MNLNQTNSFIFDFHFFIDCSLFACCHVICMESIRKSRNLQTSHRKTSCSGICIDFHLSYIYRERERKRYV